MSASRILAIDTATEACSAALCQQGEVLTRYSIAPRGHTDLILPMVAQLLADAELTLAQLDAIAFAQGPGSFTGVRITLGVAQGLAYGADLALLGVSNLQALAQGAYRVSGAETVLSAIDARMSEIYIGGFVVKGDVMQSTDQEQVSTPNDWLEHSGTSSWAVGVGSGFVTYPALKEKVASVCEALPYPEAQDLLPQALQHWQQGKGVSAALAQPVYLRDKVTWQKLPGR
ncbi:tRNA (adenosine(37)-N6)-threonylcarbamoyltransferase complex dimerization subunit type 1 TsaB [Oceanisphaera avium]|uniref:tRNA (adenosine(37)-N6)-threonylcarbamoyltransferase complex dimerization subunit type 1 TsaB n=1 Tax=Oceanisphaera avium TaxID=1903694 RepID=UPI0018DF7EC7|nr:tRNA (adenosine(37)-N6)-threonylcarbamoyltransferase complex dimerization subunit type 1 TsaB [Oceanisphaera avium]